MDFSKPENARIINKLKVLSLLKKEGLSRAELSRRLGLNKVSMSEIAGELEKEGLVIYGAKNSSAKGRPSLPLYINKNGGRVFSIEFRAKAVSISVYDLTNTLLRFERYPRDERLWENLKASFEKLRDKKPVLAAAVIIDEDLRIPDNVFPCPILYLPSWEAEAQGYIAGCEKDNENILFVSWGEDVRACFQKNGSLIKSPEFGHIKVSRDTLCECGGLGCLKAETCTSRLRSICGVSSDRELLTPENAKRLEKPASYMALALSMSAQTLSIDKIVFTSSMALLPDSVFSYIRNTMHSLLPPKRNTVEIIKAEHPERLASNGGASKALEKCFYRTDVLAALEKIENL